MSWDSVDESIKGQGGDFMRLEQGDNKIRIVSAPKTRWVHWSTERKSYPCAGEGCTYCASMDEKLKECKVRFWFHVIDRNDGTFKLLEVGSTVMKQLRKFQKKGEYAFEGDTSPYDVTIEREGANLETVYTVIPARANTELTAEERTAVGALKPLEEIIERIDSKATTPAMGAVPASGDEINVADIPF